jgi:hypothetical protein
MQEIIPTTYQAEEEHLLVGTQGTLGVRISSGNLLGCSLCWDSRGGAELLDQL